VSTIPKVYTNIILCWINILNHKSRFKFKCLGCKTEVEIFAPAIKKVLLRLLFISIKNVILTNLI